MSFPSVKKQIYSFFRIIFVRLFLISVLFIHVFVIRDFGNHFYDLFFFVSFLSLHKHAR